MRGGIKKMTSSVGGGGGGFFLDLPNINYVIYPRRTQAYNDARTSTWVNQTGYITLCRSFDIMCK